MKKTPMNANQIVNGNGELTRETMMVWDQGLLLIILLDCWR
jgi:hypothetical protein